MKVMPLSEYHEDYGPVIWWKFPVQEPPYVGTPNDLGFIVKVDLSSDFGAHNITTLVGGWPGYHTHWTTLEIPEAPDVAA